MLTITDSHCIDTVFTDSRAYRHGPSWIVIGWRGQSRIVTGYGRLARSITDCHGSSRIDTDERPLADEQRAYQGDGRVDVHMQTCRVEIWDCHPEIAAARRAVWAASSLDRWRSAVAQVVTAGGRGRFNWRVGRGR